MTEKILLVDDDPNILAGFRRQVRKHFRIDTALGGQEGLEAMESEGPFAVVVSDLRMPGMDGIEFLTRAGKTAPDTVRIMLTGNADVHTAVDAVNEGNVFRFLIKPCPAQRLAKSLWAGIEQYRLVTTERRLLKDTFSGSIKVLTEVLSLVSPHAFNRVTRSLPYVRQIATQLGLPNLWRFEVAALLSQIGCVTLTPDLVRKVEAGEPLSDEERQRYSSHPSVGASLLSHIPRLEPIARMIEGQLQPPRPHPSSGRTSEEDTIALGSQILQVALNLDQQLSLGFSPREALARLQASGPNHDPRVLAALKTLYPDEDASNRDRASTAGVLVPGHPKASAGRQAPRVKQVFEVVADDLKIGMIAHQDFLDKSGRLLVRRGQKVTSQVLQRLRVVDRLVGLAEPFLVQVAKRPRYWENPMLIAR